MDLSNDNTSQSKKNEAEVSDAASGSGRTPSHKRSAGGKRLKKDDSGINVLPESDNSDDLSDSGANRNCENKELEKSNSSESNSPDSGNLESCCSTGLEAKEADNSRTLESETSVNSDISVSSDNDLHQPGSMEASTSDCDDSRKRKELKSKCKRKNSDISSDDEDDEEKEEQKRQKEDDKYDPTPSTPRPVHNWSAPRSFISRQYGCSSKYSPDLFRSKCYGSLHMVQRLELMYKMKKHDGCVNTLNFNSAGTKLVTGSDDLDIILWDWTTSVPILNYNSGHTSNVFQVSIFSLFDF